LIFENPNNITNKPLLDHNMLKKKQLTAAYAQSILPQYTIWEVRQLFPKKDNITINALYLGNLCAQGDAEKIDVFIREHETKELRKILNCAPYEQWHGTCLHMLLKWNTGDKAIALFKLLVAHGAEYIRNHYNKYPWQIDSKEWTFSFAHINLGDRNCDEFRHTYETLIAMYSLDNSNGNPAVSNKEYDILSDSDSDSDSDDFSLCDHPEYMCSVNDKIPCTCTCEACDAD